MVKVSVLTYVLNDITHIEKCIRSVRNQTMRELEILVIDGGSTDGTLEFVRGEAREDSRIRIISCGPGVGLQFNTGLREAIGEYIGICESDDYILPDMYEKQYEVAKQWELDYLKADMNYFFELNGEEIVFPVHIEGAGGLYDSLLFPRQDLRFLKLGIHGFWSGLYRREFLLSQNIFMNETKGASYQDTSFAFMAGMKAKRAMIKRDAFYCYRQDNPNSSVNSPQRVTRLIEEYLLLKKRLTEEGFFEEYKEVYLSWKVRGLLGAYSALPKGIKEECIYIIYKELLGEIKGGRYTEEALSPQDREAVEKVKETFEDFQQYLEKEDTAIDEMKRALIRIPKDRSIIVFGNGSIGELVRRYFVQQGKNLRGFIDNNKDLWSEEKEELPIISPERATKLFPDAVYVIANAVHYEAMRTQLEHLSIKDNQIIICNRLQVLLKQIIFNRKG